MRDRPTHAVVSVVENRAVGPGAHVLVTDGGEQLARSQPGQFVMLRGEWGRDPLLPRAFSILRTNPDGSADVLVKAVGRGTRLLEGVATGAKLSVLGPLGSAFEPAENSGDWLVAGGVGLAPLLWYAERYKAKQHHLLYGARSAGDLVLLDEIRAAGCVVTLTTEDGSAPAGWSVHKGRVTDALAMLLPKRSAPGTRILTCGPNPMMRAVVELARAHVAGRADPHALQCLVSVEGEMACGIGACLGCAVPLTDGTKPFGYACTDGPVFDSARIVIP